MNYRKEICYDREVREYALYLDGELVGFARNHHEGEVTLDQLVFELLSGGAAHSADGLACTCLPDAMCSIHAPCPTRAAATAVAQYLSDSAQPFCFFCINADHDTRSCPKLDDADRVCDGLDYPCDRPVAFAVPLHPGHAIDGAPITTIMHLCSDCYTRWQTWQAIDPPGDNPLGDEEGDSTPPDRHYVLV